jgi:hypothetical protein
LRNLILRYFTNSLVGNKPPFSMSEFYGAMASRPVSPTGDVGYANGSTFTVPYYNVLIIKLRGGQAGGQGNQGFTNNDCGGDPTGINGDPGSSSAFGGFVSASGGAPNSNLGQEKTFYIYADSTPGAPTRGSNISIIVGGGGAGGRGGDQTGWFPGTTNCANYGKAGTGSDGDDGYLTVSVQ